MITWIKSRLRYSGELSDPNAIRVVILMYRLFPAEHLHQHRHHPAHDPAGAGADRRDPLLNTYFLRPPALQGPEPGLEVFARRPSVFSRSGSNEPSRPTPPSSAASGRSTSHPGSSRKTGLPGGLFSGNPGNHSGG